MVKSRFLIGDFVQHRAGQFRGVVIGIDQMFMQTDDWYRAMTRNDPPKDKPWYQVIVDGAEHVAYVSEKDLRSAQDRSQIDHPMLGDYFRQYNGNRYLSR